MKYTIKNRTDTFLSLQLGPNKVELGVGAFIEDIDEAHISSTIKFQAHKGNIALIAQNDENIKRKITSASEVEKKTRKSIRSKTNKETK